MKLLSAIICVVLTIEIGFGQKMDSIVFSKARIQSGKYELNRFGIEKIKIKDNRPTAAIDDGISGGEKFFMGALTLFTGVRTTSSSESLWRLDNKVKLTGINKVIGFPVLINGHYKKERERVKNDDGTKSIETSEIYNLYWDEGADGVIVEEGSTLGNFTIELRTMANDSIEFYKSYIGQHLWLEEQLDSYHYYDKLHDFLVEIIFKDQPYTLVYDGEYFQCALIQNRKLIGLWQDAPINAVCKWKNRITPYIQLPHDLKNADAEQTISLLTLGLSLARSQ